jgi:hypothetical protein
MMKNSLNSGFHYRIEDRYMQVGTSCEFQHFEMSRLCNNFLHCRNDILWKISCRNDMLSTLFFRNDILSNLYFVEFLWAVLFSDKHPRM